MNDIVIHAENLSKRYCIGKNHAKYGTLRDSIADASKAVLQKAGRLLRGRLPRDQAADEVLWALAGVSFEVRRGEIVGIIGRNGAGKSTLLKILSRVTEPAGGECSIRGRVGSLLEVGSGFHPELTGRENVYLNGAIIGMKRSEIDRKFDEIVNFAEVERFIDTPVKHYSSGMYLRLAFSVAAHLEPDIMLVDEVLAVGDSRFWQKSISKMRDLNAAGMTILLVTHDLWLVQTISSRAICLDKGKIVVDATPLQAIGQYKNLNDHAPAAAAACSGEASAPGCGELLDFSVTGDGEWGAQEGALPDSGLTITMKARAERIPLLKFLVRVTSPDGFPYFTVYSGPVAGQDDGFVSCEAVIPHVMLLPGDYYLWGAVCSGAAEGPILDEKRVPLRIKGSGEPLHEKSLFWNRAEWRLWGSDGDRVS